MWTKFEKVQEAGVFSPNFQTFLWSEMYSDLTIFDVNTRKSETPLDSKFTFGASKAKTRIKNL